MGSAVRKRYLLIPGNNSLSHVVKCLAVGEALAKRGQEAQVAVGSNHSLFLRQLAIEHLILPDIQESDESVFPSVEWFRRPRTIIDCIRAEVDLLRAHRPDRVLGVFRFTLKASARIAGIPYDSLICGCMTPDSEEVLGYDAGDPGREAQRADLEGFYRYAGAKVGDAAAACGLPSSRGDIRHMLKGERTFLWDFPEFAPLPRRPDLFHVGPIAWNRWPYDAFDPQARLDGGRPLAVAAFGTCTKCLPSIRRIIKVLVDRGYRVALAAGGQKEFLAVMPDDPRVIAYSFAPLPAIWPSASVLVTHGGQMTVFEALQYEVPVVVMPFQPEQAHNGVCLERLGCGARLIASQLFQGHPGVYAKALDRMSDEEIGSKISRIVRDPSIKTRLAEIGRTIRRYRGAETIAGLLEAR
ncbi:MAG: glycosyl transferase [Elusimicrobia bacterium]|nr:glycosyl transferase [Elusimicrobiota bacterium]